jgi:hypothetical protein
VSADPKVLEKRLRDVLALTGPFDKLSAAEAIKAERIEGAVCARIPAVGGRIANFSQYFAVCFSETIDGKPWAPKVKK